MEAYVILDETVTLNLTDSSHHCRCPVIVVQTCDVRYFKNAECPGFSREVHIDIPDDMLSKQWCYKAIILIIMRKRETN